MVTKKAGAKKTKDETEVLFPEVPVMGTTIRPWTWKQFVASIPIFQRVQEVVDQKGISMEEIEKKPMEMMEIILPFATEIISLTTGQPQETIEGWTAEKVMKILVVIVGQNTDQIKNSFGLSVPLMRAFQTRSG